MTSLAYNLFRQVAENKNPTVIGFHAQDVEAARLGWRESRAPACILTVAGRRGPDHGSDCPCPAWFDHVRLFITEDGAYVLQADVYGCRATDVAALVTVLDPLGLEAHLSPFSPWSPLSTLRVLVTKKESA